MPTMPTRRKQARAERENLCARLEEAEETLRAIRNGEVDALVVSGVDGDQIYTLTGADTTYRLLIEDMHEGALILTQDGVIFYANQHLADIIRTPLEKVISASIYQWVDIDSHLQFQSLMLRDENKKGKDQRGNLALYFSSSNGVKVPVYLSVSSRSMSSMPDYTFMVVTDLTEINEQKMAAVQSNAYAQYTRSLIEASLDPLIIISMTEKIADVNKATEQATGLTRLQLIGTDFSHHFTDPALARACYQAAYANESVADFPLSIRDGSGHMMEVLVNAAVYRNDAGEVQGVFAAARDITQRKKSEEKLNLAASVFTNVREGIMITTADGKIIDFNDAATRISSYRRDEVMGHNPNILSSGLQSKEFYADMWSDLIKKGHWQGEIWNRRKNGDVYAGMHSISALRDANGDTLNYVGLFSDITAIKEHEKQLEFIAHYDTLTSLPNRALLSERLQQAMTQALRCARSLAVMYLDLDGFKAVNDQYGHATGDKLLVALSARMKAVLRDGDTLCRLGGDEFVFVLLDVADIDACLSILKRLLDVTARAVHVDGYILHVSSSIGVTFYPQSEDMDADQLLRQADQAMYQAKLSGKNRYHIFDAVQDCSVRGFHERLARIRQALNQYEFVLYYQPKVNMRTGQVIGAEALIRWQHPEQGLLPPALFLPAIEDHSLAISVGEWVIDSALTQIGSWRAAGLAIPVSVNVGARQLQQTDFVERLRLLLAAHPDVNPSDLEMEVLESSAMEDLIRVSHVIEECRKLGVLFSLDDFGTGYSSLTYLKRLPVNQIKIDQSFVRDMINDPDDLSILVGVLNLGAAFNCKVIAEGVETIGHGTMLLHLGCDLAQGYGIARPMPASQFPAWMGAWRADPSWENLPCVTHVSVQKLLAGAEHRAWIASIESYLNGAIGVTPALDAHQCRLGIRLDALTTSYPEMQSVINAMRPLHTQEHALAVALCALHAQGRRAEALARLGELHAMRDGILAWLTTLDANGRSAFKSF